MIQSYTALGRYELRTNDRGEKHPVLISSRQEYAPDLCEMLLWSSLLWHIRDQKELEAEFACRRKDLHICDDYSLAYYCTRSDASLLDKLYSEPKLTCDNLPAYVRASEQLTPVLQAVTNLYLRRLLVLEQY